MKRKLIGPLTKAEARKAEQHAAYNRAWAGENSDKVQKIQLRAKHKKQRTGICTRCSNPRDPKSKSLCAECLEKGRQRSRESRTRNLRRARKLAREGARRRRAAHPVKHRRYRKQRYAAKHDEILGKRRKKEGSIPRATYLEQVKRESRGIVLPLGTAGVPVAKRLNKGGRDRKYAPERLQKAIDLYGKLRPLARSWPNVAKEVIPDEWKADATKAGNNLRRAVEYYHKKLIANAGKLAS